MNILKGNYKINSARGKAYQQCTVIPTESATTTDKAHMHSNTNTHHTLCVCNGVLMDTNPETLQE